jgi:hypothetical protein
MIMLFVALLLWVGDTEKIRPFVIPILIAAAIVERSVKPPSLPCVPTPIEIIQNSRGWTLFFAFYALAAAALALLAGLFHDFGSRLSHNPWLLFPLILAPLIPVGIQSQINLFRALANESP